MNDKVILNQPEPFAKLALTLEAFGPWFDVYNQTYIT